MPRINDLPHVIAKAVEETAEEMTFTLLSLNQDLRERDIDLPQRQVLIKVNNPWAGTFILSVSPKLLLEMTENIYGLVTDKITREMENDTLAEILNTISGRVMKEIIPLDKTYELGLPFLVENAEKEIISAKEVTNYFFESTHGEYLTFSCVTYPI